MCCVEALTGLTVPGAVVPAAVGTARSAGSRTGVFAVTLPLILLIRYNSFVGQLG